MLNKINSNDKIKESEVEEALVANLGLLKTILDLNSDLKIISRQLHLDNENRLDLLLSCGNKLILVELKTTRFYSEHKDQAIRYKKIIEGLQVKNELPSGIVVAYLLVTDYLPSQVDECELMGIVLVKYSPDIVLTAYYQNLLTSTPFLRVKPKDYGVFNFGLMNRTLIELQGGGTSEKTISSKTNLSINSTRNHLRTAIEFGIVRKRNQHYFLTDFGDVYVSLSNEGKLLNQMSNEQAELLKESIAKAPFRSVWYLGFMR